MTDPRQIWNLVMVGLFDFIHFLIFMNEFIHLVANMKSNLNLYGDTFALVVIHKILLFLEQTNEEKVFLLLFLTCHQVINQK